jgi:copper chaperone NosL
MVISDTRFLAGWRETTSREQHFDDIGCMVNAARHRDPGAGTEFWVTDYRSQSWVQASTARFVFAGSIKTPMDYGVAAFAHSEDAATLGQSAAAAVSWDEARQRVERKG